MAVATSDGEEICLNGRGRGPESAMVFILITVFIDVLGIGIIIPILPELI